MDVLVVHYKVYLQCLYKIDFDNVVLYGIHRVIHAFDKDPTRYRTLCQMVRKSDASCIFPKLQDFLKVPLVQCTSKQIDLDSEKQIHVI